MMEVDCFDWESRIEVLGWLLVITGIVIGGVALFGVAVQEVVDWEFGW